MVRRYRKVAVVFDEETGILFDSLRQRMGANQSEALRRMVRYYGEGPRPEDPRLKKRTELHHQLLDKEEHIILDIDHLILLLLASGVASGIVSPEFREGLRKVAKSHADQWKSSPPTPVLFLERLEACNFFKVSPGGPDQFTLIPTSESLRKFIVWVVADFLEALGHRAEVREDLGKILVRIEPRTS